MIVCVAASPSVDKLFEVDRLTPGAIHRPSSFVQVPGGKGLNVARAAASLGAQVRATGILGGFAGGWIEDALATEGIAGHFAWARVESRASLSVADRETSGLTEFYEHGWEIEPKVWRQLETVVAGLLTEAAWLTISGSMPLGAPSDGYANLVREAHAAGVPVALDATGGALATGLDAGPDLVKVNAEEASGLLGVSVVTREEALRAAVELRRRAGVRGRAGLVTRGAEGVVVAGPDGSALEGKLHVRGPYPVDSGDAFLAGLVVGLARGDAWPRALALALGAATANAEVPGAGRLDPSRATALADGAEVRAL